ncbi:MAG: hypothetical protein KatS3mg081_0745 [Gemmatimonadales bacterium]|nr:MAG: hypothetical protein KatS3mg081_0745 [Gemmatimonadales bacterium]
MQPRPFKVLGHRPHPALTDFPIVLFTLAWVAEVAYRVVPGRVPGDWPEWLLALALLAALPTAATGLWDYICLPSGHSAQPTAVRHLALVAAALAAFGISWILHFTKGPSIYTLLLGTGGEILLLAGGWYGGELVFRYRVGVDPQGGGPSEPQGG